MGMGKSPQMGGSSTPQLYVPAFCVGWPIVKSINFFLLQFFICLLPKNVILLRAIFLLPLVAYAFVAVALYFPLYFSTVFVGINVGDFGIYAA